MLIVFQNLLCSVTLFANCSFDYFQNDTEFVLIPNKNPSVGGVTIVYARIIIL